MAKVKIIGGAANGCNCGTLLDHWKQFSKDDVPKYCTVSEPDCLNKCIVGVPVRKTGSADKREYVVPVCRKHSVSENELEINDLYTLVPLHNVKCRKR